MKRLLSVLTTAAALLAAVAPASAASVICGTGQLNFPDTDLTCPLSGTVNGIRSYTHVHVLNGFLIWNYTAELKAAPAASASPRVGSYLLKGDGNFATRYNDGVQCPGAVDNTLGGGPGSNAHCQVPSGSSFRPTKIRIYHDHI